MSAFVVVLCVLCVRMRARCMCSQESLPRVVGIAFPSRRGDCPQPQTAPIVFALRGPPRVRVPRWGGGSHPNRGDPNGTKSSSASDCVYRRGGTFTAGRYGELYPGKAGGQWTCRPDILESTQHTAGRRLCDLVALCFVIWVAVLPHHGASTTSLWPWFGRAGYAGGLDSRFWRSAIRLFERRRGRLNSREMSGKFLFVLEGFLGFGLVDFPVDFLDLPCSECTRAALA